MLRMFARRSGQGACIVGTDEVMFGLSLPSDTVIHDIRAKISITNTLEHSIQQACRYAVEGWILPVHDPDAASTFDTLWDTLVPKDTDVQTLDLDTGAADSTPFFEPGEADWSDLFDVGLRPERIYHRQKILTLPNGGSIFTHQDVETPFTVIWIPGDSIRIHIRRRLRVRQPSVVLFAIAAPQTDDTTTVQESALAEAEWGQVKYMEHVLERAMLHVLGVVETGAETPWEEATAIIQKHLDPDVREDSAGRFTASSYEFVFEAMVDHSVVGTLEKHAVSTGR